VTLTRREHEVVGGIVDGFSSKEIARSMGVTVKTVQKHRTNLMAKLGARKAADVIRWWYANTPPAFGHCRTCTCKPLPVSQPEGTPVAY
jgi:DNA-binding CsgD family transcriptional regulator